ncbi:uncharacterized protein LOC116292064 [Actinia tenebrosa]|uniref:Uncharacterized protein LOC116292064 n=1 Tax=Actinia tenebrosa TaxID=6105 RepID=A0A6P8HJV5_ACTTE|nr:uncharacterized protein LOC116292064 [Actinia tenebrosa]
MDIISVQEYPRKRCAPSSPLEDSILLQQPKRSCSSEYYLHEMSNCYRTHEIFADGSMPTLAKKTVSQPNEERMDCSDSNIQSENNDNTYMSKKHVELSKDDRPQEQEKPIPNLYVASSFRRSPVKCSRCCAGESAHFSHLKS